MKAANISKIVLYLVCVVLAILLLFVYIFFPMHQKTSELQSQHALNTAQISFYTQKIANVQNISAALAEKKKELAKNQSLPGIEPLDIGSDISAQVKKSGAVLSGITVGDGSEVSGAKKSTDGKNLYIFTVSLSVSCTQAQFDELLKLFETSSDAMYYVSSAGLSYDESSGQYKGNIEMDMYCCLNEKAYKALKGAQSNGK